MSHLAGSGISSGLDIMFELVGLGFSLSGQLYELERLYCHTQIIDRYGVFWTGDQMKCD